MIRRILVLAAVVVAIAVGVVALVAGGNEDGGGVGPEAIAEAADRTARVDGLRYVMSGTAENPQLGRPVPVSGEGVTDVRGQRGSARFDMSAMANVMRDAGAKEPFTDPDSWRMEMFFEGRFFYMKFPLAARRLDKSWMKFDFLKTSAALGIDPAIIRASQQQGDPTAMLRQMRTVSDDVEVVGKESVGGVEATHYRATVNLRKYADVLPEKDRDKARRSIDRLIQLNGGHATSPMEVWVGKDNLVRRMKMVQTLQQPGQSTVTRNTFDMWIVDYDARVRIDPPDEGDVRDMTDEITAQLAAATGGTP